MKKLAAFALTCAIVFQSGFTHEPELSLYAVSSLRTYLEQLKSPSESDIPFNEEDIANLWESAENPSLQGTLDLSRAHYEMGLNSKSIEAAAEHLQASEELLIDAWTHLQRSSVHAGTADEVRQASRSFLLPANHPCRQSLDNIFSGPVLKNPRTFKDAGFSILFSQPHTFIVVARHKALPGYLVKCYLDSEKRQKEGIPGWKWLTQRCKGAQNVRELIKKKHLRHFVVPDKWIYRLPSQPDNKQSVILLVTDMQLVGHAQSEYAWQRYATKEVLRELYCILSHGYSSSFLPANIPYTKNGKFACIDTEHPKRNIKLTKVRPFLSYEMRHYWDELVRSGGKAR